MAKVSLQQFQKLQKRAASLRASTKKAREKAGQVVEHAVSTTETSLTAFGIGVAQGKMGPIELMGVPLELGVGIAAHVGALLGVGGAESHLKAVGDGALATYFHTVGRGVGKNWGKGMSGQLTSGPVSTIDGETLSDAELAELASY